jgi:aminopeptidase N
VLHKLDFNPGDDLLRTQLTAAPDVIGRILAARELVKTSQRANIQAVIDAYPNEPYWGVRREIAEALRDAKHETALAGLVQLLAWEQAPMVLSGLIRAAGSYRDPRVREAIQRRLEGGGLPYIATQAAYEMLGAQRDQAPWELLRAAVETPSFNGVAQSGALRGLAASRRPEAIDILLQKSRYGGVSNRARHAAVSALADIGKGQENAVRERIVEQLIDLLRDPWQPVAWTAAHGLVAMRAPEAIPAIEAFGRALAHQDQAVTERLIADLRSQDKSDGSAVRKQVEELQEKVRKLEEHVQRLAVSG